MKEKIVQETPEFLKFVLLASVLPFLLIIADFSTYPISSWKDCFYVFLQSLLLLAPTIAVIGIAAINKYIFVVVYPIFIFTSGLLAYFAITAKSTFTTMVLDATLSTDSRTAADLISPSLIISMVLLLCTGIFLGYLRFKKEIKFGFKTQVIYFLCFILIIFAMTESYKVRRLMSNHLPFNIYYVTKSYIDERETISENRPSIAQGSYCETDSLIVVFIIGESVRSDHLSINGYARNTTPVLSTMSNVYSLPYIYMPHTHTNTSVPYILTRADSRNKDIAYEERSFIDIFKACGFRTIWLANQEPLSGFSYFMHEADTLLYATIDKSVYNFDKWLDESLLPHYFDQLKEQGNKKLLILHTIGSHWWFNSHFDENHTIFRPIIESKIVSANTPEEMINSYDNTLRYSDTFWGNVIRPLKEKNAMLIYLSDHGEGLGENGVWLHAADSPPIHRPACFVWVSDKYVERYPEKVKALSNNKKKEYDSEFLFHSILGAANICSPLQKKELNVFE